MKKSSRIFLAVAVLSAAQFSNVNSLWAQNDTSNSVYNQSVYVVGDYNPVLDGVTEKVNVAPAPSDSVASELQPKFNYGITPHRISSLTSATGLKAAKVIGSPTRLYNNYLRFGLGHDFAAFPDFNPLVDLYLTSMRHDNYSYGARFYHNTDITTFGKENPDAPSQKHFGRDRHTFNNLDLFGKYILNKAHLFSADLAFDREYGRYYGFNDSVLNSNLNLSRDDISFSDYALAYNNLALKLAAKSLNIDDGKFGYSAGLALADLWGRYDISQLSAILDADIHYAFPILSKYKALTAVRFNWQGFKQRYDAPQSASQLPLGYDPLQPMPDTVVAGRHLITVNPYADFLLAGFKLHAGLAFGFNSFDTPGTTTHDLFPDLAVSKAFSNNAISLSLGFKGGYISNDWNSIRLFNPYVEPAPLSQASVDNNLYAHLRINFSKKLILNISADNHFWQNAVFYRLDNDYTLRNVFKPYYVDLNDLLFSADFTFVNDEMITLTLGGRYLLEYNTPDNVITLYSPDFTAHLDADINYKDKWLFSLSTLFISSMDAEYSLNPTTLLNQVTQTLSPRFGLSLGAEYIHSRALSFFAKIDNINAQRYFLWANYPAQRFNLMLGLTYTIPNQ